MKTDTEHTKEKGQFVSEPHDSHEGARPSWKLMTLTSASSQLHTGSVADCTDVPCPVPDARKKSCRSLSVVKIQAPCTELQQTEPSRVYVEKMVHQEQVPALV